MENQNQYIYLIVSIVSFYGYGCLVSSNSTFGLLWESSLIFAAMFIFLDTKQGGTQMINMFHLFLGAIHLYQLN